MIIELVILALAVAGFLYVRSHKTQVSAWIAEFKADWNNDLAAAKARIAKLEAQVATLLAKK
jgi:hypothetical protein